MDKKWEILNSEELFNNRHVKLRKDRCRMPDGREVPDYYVLEYSDWAHVVPVTHDGQLLLIKQYRHGIEKVCIEFPGGTIDPGEDKKAAAVRELEEETGFVPEDIRLVSKSFPNPAAQNNHLYTFVALGCQKLKDTNLDPFEDIETFTAPVPEVLQMALDGKLMHSMMVTSLFHALPILGYNLC